ncbi:MAG TPA: hypothetical protein PLB25_01990 [Rhodoferax sp.]|nr:hypothetical protein [Rhodoferax sp.]
MSLLSPESLCVFVSPTELAAVHWCGLRPQIAAKRICPVSALPGALWSGAALAFNGVLAEFSTCHRVWVILSSHFTAYQLQPWRDDLHDRQEEDSVARLAFVQTYGDVAANWQVRLSLDVPGSPRVATAVDADFLAALEQGAMANKARLVSIEPYFAAAVNHWRKQFHRRFTGWVVLHEEGQLCIGLVKRGHWQWLRRLRVGPGWQASLPDLLDNEVMLAGIDSVASQALVYSSALAGLSMPANTRWSFRSLTLNARRNFAPATDSRFGPALWTFQNATN